MSDVLFAGYEPEPVPHLDPDLSADRRLTLRQQARVRRGEHPLTHGPLHTQALRTASREDARGLPLTCGTCVFRESFQWHNRTYPKCVSHDRAFVKHSTATDVRAWWPACPAYLPTSADPHPRQEIPSDRSTRR